MNMKNNAISRRATWMTLMTVALLVFVGCSVLLFSNVTTPDIGMEVVGEDMKTVLPGETARYSIRLENRGSVDAELTLETVDTPEGWETGLSRSELELGPGRKEIIFLSVTAPSTADEGPVVAHVGVRADAGSKKTGTNNETLIETVTWSKNYNQITETLGDYTKPTKVETTATSSVVYELPDDITVKHVDASGNESHHGTTFWREITVPVDVSVSIDNDSICEMGYVGFYDYDNRNATGNPIQDSVELKANVIKGSVTVSVRPRGGGRAPGDNPLVEVLSRTDDLAAVGKMVLTIPLMDVTGGVFSAGISEDGKAELEVFDGQLDLEVKETEEEDPFLSTTLEATLGQAPRGTTITEIKEGMEANVTDIDKDAVTITGDALVLSETGTPPIEIAPGVLMVLVDPEDIPTLNIAANENYSIEVRKYRADAVETETVTMENIPAGGSDAIMITEDEITLETTSSEEKVVSLEVEEGGKSYTTEVSVKKDESFVVKDVDVENGTASVEFTSAEGKTTTEEVPSGKSADEVDEIFEEEDKETKFPWVPLVGGIVIILLIVVGAALYLGYLPTGFAISKEKKGLAVVKCSVSPESPKVGDDVEFKVVLVNRGEPLEAKDRKILVSFFEEFNAIDELDASETSFEKGEETELATVTWTPKEAGERPITIVVEIDGEDVDEYSFIVEVGE